LASASRAAGVSKRQMEALAPEELWIHKLPSLPSVALRAPSWPKSKWAHWGLPLTPGSFNSSQRPMDGFKSTNSNAAPSAAVAVCEVALLCSRANAEVASSAWAWKGEASAQQIARAMKVCRMSS
jgi:hypothetical protein